VTRSKTLLLLYGNSLSPFVRKVRITLLEKGAEFDTIELAHGADRAELLRVNPRGEVPVLVDADAVVSGSSIICDYLEDELPHPPLLPAAPAERAHCRMLERVADTETDVLQFFVFLVRVRRPELAAEFPSVQAKVSHAVERHFDVLDKQLSTREYFTGRFSRADIAFVPHLTSLVQLGETIPERCTSLRSWMERMLLRPSVQRDAAHALAAWEAAAADTDPFFRSDRIHWRGERVEWAMRFGLGAWLVSEVEAGRAYFSAVPGNGAASGK
jgi:glutathione S-transferase